MRILCQGLRMPDFFTVFGLWVPGVLTNHHGRHDRWAPEYRAVLTLRRFPRLSAEEGNGSCSSHQIASFLALKALL